MSTVDATPSTMHAPMLSVGVLNYNTSAKLRKCLDSLHTHLPDVPVVVFDNASTDDSCEMVARSFPAIQLFTSPDNLFFAWGCNRLAELCTTPYVLLMNADVFINDASVAGIVEFMETHPRLIATSPAVRDGARLSHMASGLITPWRCIARDSILGRVLRKTRWYREAMFETTPVDSVFLVPKITNSCCMIRRKEFLHVGGFSCEQVLYWTEEEFARRIIPLGFAQAVYGKAVVGHEHGSSTGTLPKSLIRAIHVRDRIHYMWRQYGLVAAVMVECMLAIRFRMRESIADYRHLVHHYRTIHTIADRIGNKSHQPLAES